MSIAAIILLTLPPIALGAFVQWWPIEPWRGRGQRYLLRMLLVTVGMQVVGAVLAVVVAGELRMPAKQPTLYLTLVAVLSVANIAAARWVRRRDDLRPPEPAAGWDRATIRRKSRTVVLWFLGTLLVAGIAVLVLEAVAPGAGDSTSTLLPLALSFAFLAAGSACLVVSWPLARQAREVRGRYVADMRRIARVVVKGKNQRLSPEDEARAARYARIIVAFYPFQLAQLTLLYLGILCQQVPRVFTADPGGLRPLTIGITGFLVVVFLIAVPVLLRQWRRAKSYAAIHPVLLAA